MKKMKYTLLCVMTAAALSSPPAMSGAEPVKPDGKQTVDLAFTPKAGDDSMALRFTLVNPKSIIIKIAAEKAEKPKDIRLQLGKQEAREYIPYGSARYGDKSVPTVEFPNSLVEFRGLGINYYLLPYFHWGRGLYSKDEVLERMPEWKRHYPGIETKEFLLEIVYEAKSDELVFFLDHQYAGRFEKSGRLSEVKVSGGENPIVSAESFKAVDSPFLKLHPRGKMHASTLLQENARLSVAPGVNDFDGIPILVYAPEESLDSGKHIQTTTNRDLGWDPYMCRYAFSGGPEYMNFGIQNRFYTYAHILCADIPQQDRVPVVGTQLTRFGNLNTDSIAFDKVDIKALVAAKDPSIRQVGTLTYTEGGQPRTVPLYLLKHRLNTGKILDIINDKPIYNNPGQANYLSRQMPQVRDYLDFEFVGAGSWRGFPRSSVQIFGCTLVESPYHIEMAQSEHGNIFHNDEKPETGLELTAREPGVKGSVRVEIYDRDFKPVSDKTHAFALKNAHVPEIVKIPLDQEKLGWYGLKFSFYDDGGTLLCVHEGAFALLGKDTREAGYESPYAAWPSYGRYHPDKDNDKAVGVPGFPEAGRHNSNPNRMEVVEMMHKAGYHTSWHLPLKSESEVPEYKMTYSQGCFNRRARCSAEVLKAEIDKGVEEFRELRTRFPHCKAILLLHETGGRDLAPEMLNRKAERGPYLGEKGDWLTYYCTEVATRLRKEFPDCDIILGNGSSSSETIASLARNGFDLNLVDRLGIESKGFQTMPELSDNREAPGMAWALRETARRFGFDIPVDVCNEYVFRPERVLTPESDYMGVTDFTLRDYLISLGHGMRYISTGHIEDAKSTYYDTNWGAGGQCKFYPYSYPKRMYVALATLTQVFDKPKFSRRLPTGELSTYALEFIRERSVQDYAYAFWTPKYDVDLAVNFPAGAKVVQVDAFGPQQPLEPDANGNVRVSCGSTPAYLISSVPAMKAAVLRHYQRDIRGAVKTLKKVTADDSILLKNANLGDVSPLPGNFKMLEVLDPDKGRVAEVQLVPGETTVPEVVWEYQMLQFRKPVPIRADEVYELGMWVKGNSSFGKLFFVFRDGKGEMHRQEVGYRGYLCFEGWHLTKVQPHWYVRGKKIEGEDCELVGFYFGSARQALDPLEMQPVTGHLRFGDVVSISKPAAKPVAAAPPTR